MTARRVGRLIGAVVALGAAAFVLVVTAAGLVGLLFALVLTNPFSHGRMVAATFTAAGLGLVLLAQLLDPQAVPRALAWGRAVSAGLALTVASRGRR